MIELSRHQRDVNGFGFGWDVKGSEELSTTTSPDSSIVPVSVTDRNTVDLQMPSFRLTASGQLVIAACSITMIVIYCCEKAAQVAFCIITRLNARPQAPEK